MTPDLLVIGTSIDPHIKEVLRHLSEDLSVVRLDLDRYPVESTLDIAVDGSGVVECSLNGQRIDHPKVCWFRRLGQPGVHEALSETHAKFVRGEVEQALAGMVSIIEPASWINEYWQCRRASSKLLQLVEAAAAGLTIPSTTVVTNRPSAVEGVLETHGELIYKTLHAPVLDYGDFSTIVYTTRLPTLTDEMRKSIMVTPCQFQPNIAKKFELRVTSIGAQNIAVKINSQAHECAQQDWRAGTLDVEYEPVDLPREVDARLTDLMTRLGLKYGASDWIVTNDDEYIFLEVNPHGAWLWMEQTIGHPLISKAISEYIAWEVTSHRSATGVLAS